MNAKLDRLTPNQQSMLDVYRDKWLAIGLATGPADMDVASAVIGRLYEACNLSAPRFVRCASPLAAVFTAGNLSGTAADTAWGAGRGLVRDTVKDTVWGAARRAVTDAVSATVSDAVRSAVTDAVSGAVWLAVSSAVRDTVNDAVWGTERGAVSSAAWGAAWGAVADALRSAVRHYLPGSGEAEWLSFYEYMRDVGGVRYPEPCNSRFDDFIALAKSCFWWYPYKDVCYVCDRPTAIHIDNRSRLHNPEGPAILFSDGFAIWRWHGVAVTEQIIMRPETLTVAQIDGEINTEVRRVMMSQFGEALYIQKSGAILIDESQWGQLWRKDNPTDEPLVMVRKVDPSTGRIYWERVPPQMRTALEAIAWQAGMTPAEYSSELAIHS